ncbi:MAG: WXG100 family type VII secretion target [Oscillospiraceae bacterium]|nr:WXG100 family type VII secretion target [Oscillospiraceae bacterium]
MIGTLKVSPEEMIAAASELSGYVSNMNECFNQMKNTMSQTESYWVGEAGEAHRQLYLEQVEKTEEIIARYTEHVRDLNAMAGVYAEAESTAQAKAEELPMIDL